MNPDQLELEQIVDRIKQAEAGIEELEAARVVLRDEIVNRLEKANLKATTAGNYSITRVVTTKIKCDLEKAKALGATKTKEVVDTVKLKKLADAGVEFEKETYSYPLIKDLDNE